MRMLIRYFPKPLKRCLINGMVIQMMCNCFTVNSTAISLRTASNFYPKSALKQNVPNMFYLFLESPAVGCKNSPHRNTGKNSTYI